MEPRRGESRTSLIAGIMKARLAVIVATWACLLVAGAPAIAQQNQQNTTAPAQNGLIGNPQLKDFSLNGTVTRTAPAQPPKPNTTPANQAASTVPKPAPTTTAQPRRTASAGTAREPAPSRERPAPPPSAATTDLPPASQPVDLPSSPIESDPSLPAPAGPAAMDSAAVASPATIPILPWIVAALALLGAGAWYFFRRRPRESFAGAGTIDLFDAGPAPPPETKPASPAPPPASPRAQAAAPQPAPSRPQPAAPPQSPAASGIVSTRLRPWLEIHFAPDRGVVDAQKAAIAFDVSIYNSGNMPARDVLLEAALFNAGAMQDQQIQLFFDNPIAKGDRIPVIPPMQRVSVNTAVFLAREQVQPIELGGRTFFVPIVAFNALYNWGRNKGQTSASYLVGKDTGAEKLAPFRLDLGPRIFRGLAAREHSLGVRK